jgi:hypothetical protein
MGSDLFHVRVAKLSGTEVTLDLLTGTAGGLDDYCDSRSFALVCLHDALRRSVDDLPRSWDEPARRAEATSRMQKHGSAPLVRALAGAGDWYVNEAWMRENVGAYIEACSLLERRNDVGEEELSRRERAIQEKHGGVLYTNRSHLWRPDRWARSHNFTLRVLATRPEWLSHLSDGLEFGTTAYDVWFER